MNTATKSLITPSKFTPFKLRRRKSKLNKNEGPSFEENTQ